MDEFLRIDPDNPKTLAAIAIGMNTAANDGRLSDHQQEDIAQYPAPRVEPQSYPGNRPETSFLADHGGVFPVRAFETQDGIQFGFNTPEGIFDLNDLLEYYGATAMEDRIPIIGFGSNANPGQLVEKFSEAQDKQGDITNPIDRRFVPAIKGSIKDLVSVYSSKLGIRGYVFAELHEEPGCETDVYVTFLSPDQLKRMTRSEGAYVLCNLGEVQIDGMEKPIAGYSYVGKNELITDESGHPIRVQGINSNSSLPNMSEEDLLNHLAERYGAELNARYPDAEIKVMDGASLSSFMINRKMFVKPDDEKIGVTLKSLLAQDGRVAAEPLLDRIPEADQNITPKTFGELYTPAHDRPVE